MRAFTHIRAHPGRSAPRPASGHGLALFSTPQILGNGSTKRYAQGKFFDKCFSFLDRISVCRSPNPPTRLSSPLSFQPSFRKWAGPGLGLCNVPEGSFDGSRLSVFSPASGPREIDMRAVLIKRKPVRHEGQTELLAATPLEIKVSFLAPARTPRFNVEVCLLTCSEL